MSHRAGQLRFVTQEGGIEGQVAVRGVGGDRDCDISITRAEVDSLGSHDDDSLPVRCQGEQRVEQHPSRRDVQRVEHGAAAHSCIRSGRVSRRQRFSFSAIQRRRASPSAGMRPFPVRQSTAACETAT